MIEKLIKLADTSKNHVDEIVSSIPGKFKNQEIIDAARSVQKSLVNIPGLKDEANKATMLLAKAERGE